MIRLDKPPRNIGEITLIGTGGGYGESCVVHLGEDNWIVVDSCINPNTQKALPYEYLKEIGIDVKNSVKLIICTHWHDDHVLGISKVLEECENAQFVMANVHDKRKFLQLVSLDYKKIEKNASNSSTKELNRCLEILKKRKTLNTPIFAVQDRTLLNTSTSKVFALSPSDFTILEFDREISTLITEFGTPERKIISRSPNSKSVALLLSLGQHCAILGADLEVGNDSREGWLNILEHNQVINQKSSLFKVPHHGSENGFHERIWLELLENNVVAKLTPWNKNGKLPDIVMLEKLSKKTEKLYMTSRIVSDKHKQRDRDIEKMIKKFNDSVREIRYQRGIIRSRIDLHKDSQWQVDILDEAFHVNPEFV